MRQSHITALWLSAAIIVPTGHVWAQSSTLQPTSNITADAQTYSPEYFVQFAPQTAADMVARLPGFEIRGGDHGARGFGQASLNILINGRRPSSKSSSARDILGRIPASNVTRIEIVDGATLDVAGLTGQVANIITKTGELSGSWNYAARFEKGSRPQLGDGGINFSAQRGRLEVVGGLDFGHFSFTEDGDETFFDGAGDVLQDRVEKLSFNNQRPAANLNFTYLRDNGDIANLNLSGRRQNRNITVQETFSDLTDADLSGRSVAENGEDRDRFEISGDYSFEAPALGREGRLKFIALHRTDTLDLTNRFNIEDVASGRARYAFIRDETATENIARAEYTFKTGQTSDWSFAIEGVLNTLESDSSVFENEVLTDEENIRVEEDRLQSNLTRSWAINDRTNAQTSIGAEYSVIDNVTDNDGSDSFFRPKGLANLSYQLNDSWTLRGQIERSVGQLDFGTYVSGVNFSAGTTTQGGKIVPEQSWEAEVELQHQNSEGLSGRAKLFYEIIEDPVVQILFEDDTQMGEIIQGPGNLDSNAKVYGIEGNVTWVLDNVLQGLRLTAEGLLADSTIEDVVTLKNRSRGGQTLWDYEIAARWDIENTPYAVEVELEHSRRDDRFRIDEKTDDILRRPELKVALTHKSLFGMQWTAKVQNIFDFELRRERFIYDGTRLGDLEKRELTHRTRGQRFSIEVTDTF